MENDGATIIIKSTINIEYMPYYIDYRYIIKILCWPDVAYRYGFIFILNSQLGTF